MNDEKMTDAIDQATEWIVHAGALLVTAGAGMGVDSGLPDFRGDDGFWQAYPALGRGRIRFVDIANGQAFRERPALAWGFYGHRLQLYRETVPHAGFRILRDIGDALPGGAFVFTSNVDGQFQRAGFSEQRIVEHHGSIHFLQCVRACEDAIWSAETLRIEVDEASGRTRSDLPRCPHCGGLARPNILMFNDDAWVDTRSEVQAFAMDAWEARGGPMVVIELGAGVALPSVRRKGESMQCPLIRFNPAASQTRGANQLGIALPALQGLRLLQERLRQVGFLAAAA